MNNTVRALNSRLTPLGIHIQKLPNDEFYVAYVANGKGSYILVSMNPKTKQATLTRGGSNVAHRGQGVATALRAIAIYILHAGGYQRVHHLGINSNNLVPWGNDPISTRIVRKHLGFVKTKNNNIFFHSNWTPTPNTLKLLGSTMAKSYANMQKASRGRNLTFNGNVRHYIPKNNGPPKNKKKSPPRGSAA